MKPHIKDFKFSKTYNLPISEINKYADDFGLKIIAMTVIFGGTTYQQSVIVSFEPWEYNPSQTLAKGDSNE